MRWWWVNHGKTRNQEVSGGYLWSPKRDKNNARNQTYENMILVHPGDIVFSYADVVIGAIGIALGFARETPKPTEFGVAGANWSHSGWYIPTRFQELKKPFRPKSYIEIIKSLLPEKYSPIRGDGNGNQKFYLTEISAELAALILGIIKGDEKNIIFLLKSYFDSEMNIGAEIKAIDSNGDLSNTEKEQIIVARRGQGIFRSRVLAVESSCRVTGVDDPGHLVASHIKPWRMATNAERLDGYNGLLLSPHIDHLFDSGFISFDDDGSILLSRHLSKKILLAWFISENIDSRMFHDRQKGFLDFHRKYVFEKK